MIEVERSEIPSRGAVGAALGTGIAGLSLGVLNGGLGNILGGWGNNNCGGAMFAWERELSHKDAEIGSLRADIATDRKILELYQYVDGRMRGMEGQLAQQAVVNAQITANLSCQQQAIATLNGLTKTVIPIASICPEVMPRYNSFVTPTDTPATGA